MAQAPDPHSGKHRGYAASIAIATVSILFLFAFILPTRSTPNLPSILGACTSGFLGLLQIPFIHDWFLRLIARMNQSTSTIVKKLKITATKLWEFRTTILLFSILGIIIIVFVPISATFNDLLYTYCVQGQAPLFACSDGVYVTPMQVNEGQNGQHIVSDMNIGIINTQHAGPFNQYDAINGGREEMLERFIFTENQNCHHSSYGTLIITTTLSQSVVDPGLSSSVGLDTLRGAYLAQFNFNREQKQFCLHLLIANFGTKGVSSQTIPVVMQQIRLYAEKNRDTFMGVVGFPFSTSAQAALYSRSQIPNNDFPIISPSAAADSFTKNPSVPPPANFYTNFHRMVAPVTVEGRVLADFMQNYSQNILTPTEKITILFQDQNDPYSESLSNAIFQSLSGDADIRVAEYQIGQPDSLKQGIDMVRSSQCPPGQQCKPVQIFFSGYADDLNVLKNKLQTARAQGLLTQPTIRLIGGEGFYDLGSYNPGNYSNLFFAMDASSDQINPLFPADEIPAQYRRCPGQIQPFNCEFSLFFSQVYPGDIYGSELAGTHALLTYDAIRAFVEALKLNSGETTSSPLWQAISQRWLDVKFEGVSGKIQFSEALENLAPDPVNKSMYVACTDSRGFTHIVAAYVNTEQSPLSPTIHEDELQACLQGS